MKPACNVSEVRTVCALSLAVVVQCLRSTPGQPGVHVGTWALVEGGGGRTSLAESATYANACDLRSLRWSLHCHFLRLAPPMHLSAATRDAARDALLTCDAAGSILSVDSGCYFFFG
jgi:hypothetical protein